MAKDAESDIAIRFVDENIVSRGELVMKPGKLQKAGQILHNSLQT